MFNYICIFLSLIFLFTSLFILIKKFFSKLIVYWILPIFINIILFIYSFNNLILLLSNKPLKGQIELTLFLALSLFWIIFIFVYINLLKKVAKKHTYEYDSAKIRDEAKYINKLELRRYNKKKRKEERNRKRNVKKSNNDKLVKYDSNNNWDNLYE